MDLDLDALRVARAERGREERVLHFGGKTFRLVDELPWNWHQLDDRTALLELLGGEDKLAEFLELKPTRSDLTELVAWAMPMYGFIAVGEASASSDSSESTSSRSRPTSKRSTAST